MRRALLLFLNALLFLQCQSAPNVDLLVLNSPSSVPKFYFFKKLKRLLKREVPIDTTVTFRIGAMNTLFSYYGFRVLGELQGKKGSFDRKVKRFLAYRHTSYNASQLLLGDVLAGLANAASSLYCDKPRTRNILVYIDEGKYAEERYRSEFLAPLLKALERHNVHLIVASLSSSWKFWETELKDLNVDRIHIKRIFGIDPKDGAARAIATVIRQGDLPILKPFVLKLWILPTVDAVPPYWFTKVVRDRQELSCRKIAPQVTLDPWFAVLETCSHTISIDWDDQEASSTKISVLNAFSQDLQETLEKPLLPLDTKTLARFQSFLEDLAEPKVLKFILFISSRPVSKSNDEQFGISFYQTLMKANVYLVVLTTKEGLPFWENFRETFQCRRIQLCSMSESVDVDVWMDATWHVANKLEDLIFANVY